MEAAFFSKGNKSQPEQMVLLIVQPNLRYSIYFILSILCLSHNILA
jgi:hypothetical protein